MIKVTCQIEDFSTPSMPSIRIHSHFRSQRLVEVEIDSKRYVVRGDDLIASVKNAMNTNQ